MQHRVIDGVLYSKRWNQVVVRNRRCGMLTFSRKILVVDDEAQFADLCRSVLGGVGHDVHCSSNGEQAVDVAERTQFDLALVNGRLSGADGLETFSRLRLIDPHLVGILVVGFTEVRLLIEAMNGGFAGVLEKPVAAAALLQRVQGALAMTRLREENTRLKTLIPLYELGKKFLAVTTVEQIYQLLVQVIHLELAAPIVSVMMLDKEHDELRIVASEGIEPTIAEQVRLQPGEKIAGWVFAHAKPVVLNRRTQHTTQFSTLLTRTDIAASISLPLTLRGEVAGVVNVSDRNESIEYSQADMEMLSVITSQAIMALENVLAMREREQAVRLRTLFEQYVAPEVAEFLINREERMIDVGEIRNLTVLFADIRNFTGLVQHISPEELRLFLNQFFELFTNIIFSARGTLDKFMGDAALVLFGAPVPIDNPAESAVAAAVDILRGFEALRLKWAESSPWFLNVGIGVGISMGEVYLGNVGSEKRLDFTVIGTNVNIAQRLASETNSGQILITESVNRAVAEKFSIVKEGARQLRGLDQSIQIYSVTIPEMTNHVG